MARPIPLDAPVTSAVDQRGAADRRGRDDKSELSHPVGTVSVMEISCDDCVMQDTPACEDCVVTFICGREPGEAVVFDVAEARAVRLLGEAGLVPPLRRQARAGS
jgi:hypothetical protein